MTYSDYLLGISRDLRTSRPAQALGVFFAGYRMYPDVRDALIDEFYKYGSLYRVIRNKINAQNRLKEIIQHALDFSGNVALNITGEPRIGKSTVARWVSQQVHKTQFGTLQGWKDRLLFARSYSRATEQLSIIAKQYQDEALDDEQVLNQLKGYCLVEDENQIEHEKDSVKAKEDMTNIAETCASSGIHFLYLSPKRRGFGYATLLVVGIDPVKNLNLSFYQDNQGNYRGYLETPNIPAISEYLTQKNRVVVQTLVDRGRVKAKAIEFDEAKEVPVEITVPPDADFITIYKELIRHYFLPLVTKKIVIERWILRYFEGKTFSKIMNKLGGNRVNTISDSVNSLDERIEREKGETFKGDILEIALQRYLNTHFSSFLNKTELNDKTETSSQEFFRRGWRDCDVAVPGAVAVNAKLKQEHRRSWQLECLPEAEVLTERAFLVLVELGPSPTTDPPNGVHVHVYPAHTPTVNTGSCEELEWEKWLEELRGLLEASNTEE